MDQQLERILANEELSGEILQRLRRDLRRQRRRPEALETPDLEGVSAPPSVQLRRLANEQRMLEKIIRDTGRPALLVQGGTFQVAETDFWGKPLEAARPVLEQAIRSVGRVELRDHPERDWGGTAWIVDSGIAVTNRHVANLFSTLREGQPVFRRSPSRRPIRASVDFVREYNSDEILEIAVEEVLYLALEEEGVPDVALLRLAKHDRFPDTIPLSTQPVRGGQQVAVIGYSAYDWDEDPDLQRQTFGVYDVKRLSPGEVMTFGAGELSHDCSTLGGNSGSVVLDLATGKAIGLHFAGLSRKANYAVEAEELADRLTAVRRRARPAPGSGEAPRTAPVPKVTSPEALADRRGYDPRFLGDAYPVALPDLGRWNDDLATSEHARDGLLHYTHFSVALSRSRRMPLFAAVNIDGRELRRLVRKEGEVWYLDGRLPAELQIGDDVYAGNPLDRGHMVRRLDPVWGTFEEAEQADADTFHFTNACPQHQNLNRKTWLSLEDYILEGAGAHDLRVSVFTGPVLAEDDRIFNNRDRSAEIRLPAQYWKVAVLVPEESGQLSATAYLLSQRDLISRLEFAYGAFRTYQVPVALVERLTGLDFGLLRHHDPLGNIESPSLARRIEGPEDLLLQAPSRGPAAWKAPVEKLRSALENKDAAALETALQEIHERLGQNLSMPEATAETALARLRKFRKFEELVALGEALSVRKAELPSLQRHWAQGLIETRRYEKAHQVLLETWERIESELARLKGSPGLEEAESRLRLRPELAEVIGLLGRLHKQRCVDAASAGDTEARREDARRSLAFYHAAYRTAPVTNLWHGINYVAFGKYTQRNLVGVELPEAPATVAEEILGNLEYLETRGMLSVWDYATRAEALLALDRRSEAQDAYRKYICHPDLDNFARGSTCRQLVEIWNLAEGDEILGLFGAEYAVEPDLQLQARFLDAPYSRVGSEYSPPGSEAMSRSRARTVARLGRSVYEGDGTGFLFDGRLISPNLGGKPLLLTCAHVCPEGVKPQDVRVIFFGAGRNPQRNIVVEYVELLWHSPSTKLDAALLLLDAAPYGVEGPPIASPWSVQNDDVAFIIGHPLGGTKLASLLDNQVREVDSARFRYTSATDPGSSGSPVFDQNWNLTGLHHAGVASKKLNEAIRLDRILEELKKQDWSKGV